MHVGFTGNQIGMMPEQLSIVRFHMQGDWFHHGDCIGSDAQAHALARRKGFQVHRHPPDKAIKRAFCDYDIDSPEKPYLERNRDIVFAADLMIAAPGEFTEQLRSGTWTTIRYARKAAVPLIIVYPDGSFTQE